MSGSTGVTVFILYVTRKFVKLAYKFILRHYLLTTFAENSGPSGIKGLTNFCYEQTKPISKYKIDHFYLKLRPVNHLAAKRRCSICERSEQHFYLNYICK